jgi:hypothetical protein
MTGTLSYEIDGQSMTAQFVRNKKTNSRRSNTGPTAVAADAAMRIAVDTLKAPMERDNDTSCFLKVDILKAGESD